jgi:hypothetical protein
MRAVLSRLGILMLMMTLGACAHVKVTTPEMTISTMTLWKDIKTAEAATGDVILSLGSSTSADEAKTLVALCLLFPEADGCP